jgi:hypothetical protein
MGFPCPIVQSDLTLFDTTDHGAVSAGIASMAVDLDLEFSRYLPLFEQTARLLGFYVAPTAQPHQHSVLAVTEVESPGDFLPRGRRLSVGQVRWMSMSEILDSIESFDEWTQFLFAQLGALGNRIQSDAEPSLFP